ncbi:hypothetical protein, partial [Lysinibacillus xylanilyticus]|uniref:hypothetical protein n=1 Tax=Lysinibacillus xylanilyticus TaxID=582475 RepID=UPI0036DA5979
GNITLKEFFPDSLHCIIHNKHSDRFFAGHMAKEFIYEVPILKYKVQAITDKLVVLMVWIGEDTENSKPQFMILKDGSYELKKKLDFEDEGDSLRIAGKNYSLETTEVAEWKYDQEQDNLTYFYEDSNFVIKDGKSLYFESKDLKTRLMLADDTGSYIGYYLPVNEDGTISLHGRKFKMIKRLTLPLSIVQDLESEEYFFLSCVEQMLLNLKDFNIFNYNHIGISNGIALLFADQGSEEVLNIFTPNHQRIILEPKYKVNDKAFGNGLYFAKDNVLLLDNGSLIFTEPVSEGVVRVKDKEVQIPTRYFGDL